MDMNRTCNWIAIATNIAVLIGVILVVIELRQNNELARLEALQERRYLAQQAEMPYFDPEVSRVWVKSIMEPESLTMPEIRTMDAYLFVQVSQMNHLWQLQQAGLMSQEELREWMKDGWEYVFSNTFAKTWWELNSSGFSHLVDADEIIASYDENLTRRDYETMQRLLKERAQGAVGTE